MVESSWRRGFWTRARGKELAAAQKALDRILLWNFDTIPLMQVEGPHVIYWDKFGRPPYDTEFRTSFPASLWYDEEKAARIPSPD